MEAQEKSAHVRWRSNALVMHRGGWAGQVVNLVDLNEERLTHVMANKLEVGQADQVCDVVLAACEEIVNADHLQGTHATSIRTATRNRNKRRRLT